MNKPTQNFKISSTTKYLLSTIVDNDARNTFRRNMIQAQIESEKKPTKEDKKK